MEKFLFDETEHDAGIRKLVEFIFVKKFQVTDEMTAQDSSFPPFLLTTDFPLKLRCVLLVRQEIVCEVYRKSWPEILKVYGSNWLSSSKAYLTSVLSACVAEHFRSNRAFDSFLGACGLARFFSFQMSQETGRNYQDFNTDIVLEFCESVLKNPFFRCGGFHRLVGYIHQHKYLKWNLDENDLAVLDNPSAHVNVPIAERLEKELIREHNARTSRLTRKIIVEELDSLSEKMALKILSTTSVKLAPIASSQNTNQTVFAVDLNEKAKTAERSMEMKAALKSESLDELSSCLSLNSYSTGSHAAKQEEFITRFESIIQAIIKHNRTESLDLTNWDNQLLEKASGILGHLKDTIKSLIEVLHEYNKK